MMAHVSRLTIGRPTSNALSYIAQRSLYFGSSSRLSIFRYLLSYTLQTIALRCSILANEPACHIAAKRTGMEPFQFSDAFFVFHIEGRQGIEPQLTAKFIRLLLPCYRLSVPSAGLSRLS